MAVNCDICGASMAVAERTTKHSKGPLAAATGNFHVSCEYSLHLEDVPAASALKPCATLAKNNLIAVQTNIAATPASAPAGTASVSGGALSVGNYKYVFTNVSAAGESLPSPASANITTAGANLKTAMTGIVAGPTGTTARKLYRTQVGGAGPFNLVTTIADNVTTTFADLLSDATIVALAQPPTIATFALGEWP